MAAQVQALKLFFDQEILQVALFSEATASTDGWLQNLPAEEVFLKAPSLLPHETLIPLDQCRHSAEFRPAFLAGLGGEQPVAALEAAPEAVKLGKYIQRISKKTGVAPAVVKTVCLELLKGLAGQVRSGTPFLSPHLVAVPGEAASTDSQGAGPATPSAPFLRLEAKKKS